MFGFSIWHVLLVLLVVALFFGRGWIPGLMRDLGQAIRAFRREMNPAPPPPVIIEPRALPDRTKDVSRTTEPGR
jgi:sec-independent protein translocase protein TatA